MKRLERVTRLELATSSLARRCSTTELHPHFADRNNVQPPARRNLLIANCRRLAHEIPAKPDAVVRQARRLSRPPERLSY